MQPKLEAAVPVTLCGGTLALFYVYTLRAPYFLDSYGYLNWIASFNQTGEFSYGYRFANTLLYYIPVTLVGEAGLAAVSIVVATLLSGAYYLMVRRDFSTPVAIAASLVFFTAPSTFISATHLKEDLTSLLCFTVCILLTPADSRAIRWIGAGVAYGFALLFKEIMLGALPFVAAYAYVRRSSLDSYKQLLSPRALGRVVGPGSLLCLAALVVIVVVSPTRFQDFLIMASSPYMGKFYGVISHQLPIGYQYWTEALLYLHPWYLLAVLFFLARAPKRPPSQALYLLSALALFVFLANSSVIRMRHYVAVMYFVAPILAEGAYSLASLANSALARRSHRRLPPAAFTIAMTALLACFQVLYVIPTAEYRIKYNPLRGFFGPLGKRLPDNALLLGMDDCPIATYESTLECQNRPPDLTSDEAEAYAASIEEAASRRPVYLLPDFFSYDAKGAIRKNFTTRFNLKPAYKGWYENYHGMTYSPTIDHMIKRVSFQRDCLEPSIVRSPKTVSNQLQIEQAEFYFYCDEAPVAFSAAVYRNHLTNLREAEVLSLERLGSDGKD